MIRGTSSWKMLVNVVVKVAVWLTRLIPRRLWLRIREASSIVGRLDYEKKPIYLAVNSWIENDVRLVSCRKEPETIEWIEKYFQPGDVFYDVGANVGAYSLVAFSWLDGALKTYAFEPGFMTFPQLCRNIYLNKAGASIVPLQVALSAEEGMTPFHYENLSTGGALHALGESINQHGKEFRPVFTLPTLSFTLDGFAGQFGLPNPNHIKIDVDGTEFQILKGAQETLGSPELRSLFLEVNEERGDVAELISLIESNKFSLQMEANGNRVYARNG